MAMFQFPLRLCHDRSGAVAVEFALILPVLIAMLAGMIDVQNNILAGMDSGAAAHYAALQAQAVGGNVHEIAKRTGIAFPGIGVTTTFLTCPDSRACEALPNGTYALVTTSLKPTTILLRHSRITARAIIGVD